MTTPRTVESDLGWALRTVFRTYHRSAEGVLADLPGGPRGYLVLTSVGRGDPPSQLALAQQLGVDRTVMTYLLDDLEKAGLVERRPDPADRRARRVVLTASGQERLCAVERELAGVEDRVLAPLEASERDVLRDLLRRLATHTGAEPEVCTEPDPCAADAPAPRRRRR